MILIIDNYDSFTYNLYQLIGQLDPDIKVVKNDELNLDEIRKLEPDSIVISPGPGNPGNKRDFGVCNDVILELGGEIPILGVCLGHQGIFAAFGGEIVRNQPVHGKQSSIVHDGKGLFKGLENPLPAARYHSLSCSEKTTPECVEVTARTKDDMIMGIKHVEKPIYGLQFHPESVGTDHGIQILKNFLEINQ
ncbi:glutamine amidotransferase of anthranilate synthase [Methanobacterium lacus]|uniref:anthranilate synthase n=1 Tax=Methanobacterium lacus (strain AL-21) TaxID=877455 RepID=F0TBJ7_METLA|nr:aminodeoxychorismate/anthranilate synthase component II [Methanobacterium lacus]ADZ10266.1 glutamine amidotransferase of anthranilate synthase [Methanobacterium lacus]